MAGGRPTILTPETLAKLEQAFLVGATDLEACFFADISKSTLYNYQNAHPEFLDRKEALKESLKIRAKMNLAKSLNQGDTNDSRWYLERRSKDEFAQRQVVQHAGHDGGELVSKIEIAHVNAALRDTE